MAQESTVTICICGLFNSRMPGPLGGIGAVGPEAQDRTCVNDGWTLRKGYRVTRARKTMRTMLRSYQLSNSTE